MISPPPLSCRWFFKPKPIILTHTDPFTHFPWEVSTPILVDVVIIIVVVVIFIHAVVQVFISVVVSTDTVATITITIVVIVVVCATTHNLATEETYLLVTVGKSILLS